jgi:uncharacterized protein (DUF4415 family)
MKREYDLREAKRAHFKGLPPLSELGRHTKVRITIMLDKDVLDFFKARAAKPNADPYQTQINRTLREIVDGSRTDLREELVKDEDFISRISERVAAYSGGMGTRQRRGRSRAQAKPV